MEFLKHDPDATNLGIQGLHQCIGASKVVRRLSAHRRGQPQDLEVGRMNKTREA